MNYTISQSDIALITTQKVEHTFKNQHAYLHAVIKVVTDDEQNKTRTYKVRTDLVDYLPIQELKINSDGSIKLDETGSPIYETKYKLTWLEQKQDWTLQEFTYAQIDAFAKQVESKLPTGLSRTEKDVLELQIMFETKRKDEAPWNHDKKLWRRRTNQDLIRKQL